jgi:small subunit ribosomal protein S1
VVRADLENGQVVLSKKRAEADQSWVRIQSLYEQGEPVMVEVKEKVKGGLVATMKEFVPSCLPAKWI